MGDMVRRRMTLNECKQIDSKGVGTLLILFLSHFKFLKARVLNTESFLALIFKGVQHTRAFS